MKYRPEIDGLRTIAVMPVIFFHGGLSAFSGGFVGVDVFFVISGYLITSLLIDEIDAGKFRLINFYERRIRRILPALYLVTITTAVASFLILMPREMEAFSRSLFAVVTFSSNILFWRESGYFSTEAELKPLLHTWSLSIEEQYYIIFPIFLLVCWRFGRKAIFLILMLVFLTSVILGHWGANINPSANFYLLPTRGWELIMGAFCAFLIHKDVIQLNRHANILSLLGLALILYSVFGFDTETQSPSFYILLPTVGTGLIILFANANTWTHKILTVKGMVAVGLISYSAYLWHQPLFALSKYQSQGELDTLTSLGLSAVILGLAYLSWRFIERPFRTKRFSRGFVFSASIVLTIVIGAVGVVGHLKNGFEKELINFRYSDEKSRLYFDIMGHTDYNLYDFMHQETDCNLWATNADRLDGKEVDRCYRLHGKATVLLGDSHAMSLFNILAKSGKIKFLIGISQGGCRVHKIYKTCQYADFDTYVEEHRDRIRKIYYHQAGSYYVVDTNGHVDSQASFRGNFGGIDEGNIIKTIEYLVKLEERHGVPVNWIGPFTEYRFQPLDTLDNPNAFTLNQESVKIFKDLEDAITRLNQNNGYETYISFDDLFAIPKNAFQGDCFMYRDLDHFSRCGEWLIAREYGKNLDRLNN